MILCVEGNCNEKVVTVKVFYVKRFECTEPIELNSDENTLCERSDCGGIFFVEMVYTINMNRVYLHEKMV